LLATLVLTCARERLGYVRGEMLSLIQCRMIGRWFGPAPDPWQACNVVHSCVLVFVLGSIAAPASMFESIARRGESTRARDVGASVVVFALSLSLVRLAILHPWSPLASTDLILQSVSWESLRSPWWPLRDLEEFLELVAFYSIVPIALACSTLASLRRRSLWDAAILGALVTPVPAILAAALVASREGQFWVSVRQVAAATIVGIAVPVIGAATDRLVRH
jgi:hypothetical protein